MILFKGFSIWMTGLSGSGKTTTALALQRKLYEMGFSSYILDGDCVRSGLCEDLGFSDSDRLENIRRVSHVAKIMINFGLIVIVSTISPSSQHRKMAKIIIGDDYFLEVFVDTPLQVCIDRDPKGLYSKALQGEIKNFTGISSVYDRPSESDINIDGSKFGDINKSVDDIYMLISNRFLEG